MIVKNQQNLQSQFRSHLQSQNVTAKGFTTPEANIQELASVVPASTFLLHYVTQKQKQGVPPSQPPYTKKHSRKCSLAPSYLGTGSYRPQLLLLRRASSLQVAASLFLVRWAVVVRHGSSHQPQTPQRKKRERLGLAPLPA